MAGPDTRHFSFLAIPTISMIPACYVYVCHGSSPAVVQYIIMFPWPLPDHLTPEHPTLYINPSSRELVYTPGKWTSPANWLNSIRNRRLSLHVIPIFDNNCPRASHAASRSRSEYELLNMTDDL